MFVAGQRKPAQARDRAVGTQLRTIRETQTNLSLEAAASLMQWSPATMSRTENGKRHISPEDVAAVLAIYRVPLAQREELVARAKTFNEPGWWSRPQPGMLDPGDELASHEAGASRITNWAVNSIPGLLHTYEYAMACLLDEGLSVDDAESRWAIRHRRQQILPKIDYTAFISESALRLPFGGGTFIKQLVHLYEAPERGLAVRIVPEHPPHVALTGSWILLEYPNSPPMVHIELLVGGIYIHDEQVKRYLDHRARLDKIALSTAETRDMLRKLMEKWRKASGSGSTSDCVELSNRGTVRDSKNPAGPVLRVDLAGFVAAIKRGRFGG